MSGSRFPELVPFYNDSFRNSWLMYISIYIIITAMFSTVTAFLLFLIPQTV
jgi:hypothetical protein